MTQNKARAFPIQTNTKFSLKLKVGKTIAIPTKKNKISVFSG
jgi:hypothetical protein